MKKIIILLLLLTFQSYGQKKTPSTDTKYTDAITYHNALVKIYNDFLTEYEGFSRSFEQFETRNEKLIIEAQHPNNSHKQLHTLTIMRGPKKFSEHINSIHYEGVKTIPATIQDKNFYINTITQYIDLLGWVENESLSLNDYINQKTYLRDTDLKQFHTYTANIKDKTKQIYELLTGAIEKSEKVSNEAELYFLKKYPLADVIIPMKQLLIEQKNYLKSIEKGDSNISEQMKAKIRSLYEQNHILSDQTAKRFSDYYYREVYEKFYDHAQQILNRGVESENDLNYMFDQYNQMIDRYNTFINQ